MVRSPWARVAAISPAATPKLESPQRRRVCGRPHPSAIFSHGPRRRLPVALPALTRLVPPYVSLLARRAAWPALDSTSGGVHAYTRAPSWMAALGMPAAPSSMLEAVALGIIGGGAALFGTIALLRARSRAVSIAYGWALIASALAWGASHIGVGMSGASVASAWASPALSLAFMILVVLSCSGHLVRADAAADAAAWDASRPFALRALGALIAVAIAGSASAASVAAVAGRSNPDDIPTFTMSQRETVSALSSPIVSAVASQAQRSPRAGRILVLDGDPTNGTVNAALWRGNGRSLTDASPAVRALVLSRARAGAATGTLDDPATASLAPAAYPLVVYPDDATVATLAAHDVDTILVPYGASGAQALTLGLDRAGGLEKVGTTNSGIVWRVRPSAIKPSRVRVESSGGITTDVGSSQLRVDGNVDASGTLVLAERADSGWRASVDGVALTPTDPVDGWAQAFDMPAAGHLTVTYSAWWIIPWRIAAGACLVVALASALSAWRKRRRSAQPTP